MDRRRGLGLALLSVGACALEPAYQWLPSDGARSALLLEPSRGGLNVAALSLEGPISRSFASELREPVHVLGYAQTLEDLGFEVGPVPLDPEGRPVPTPTWVRAWSPEDDVPTFRRVAALPAEALALRLGGQAPCPRLEAEPVTLAPSPREPHFLGAIDEARALLGTDRGVFLVESATVSLLRELAPEAAYSGLYVPALGAAVYVARADGQIFSGRPGEGFRRVAQLPPVLPAGLAGFGAGPDLVLYGLSSTSTIHRWEGARLETQRVLLDPVRGPRLGAFGPRSVVVYRGGRQSVVELAEWPQPPKEQLLDLQPDDELRGLRNIVGLGPVLASRDGLAFRRGDVAWELHFDSPTATTPFVLEQAFGGTLFGGEDAVLGLILRDGQSCGSVAYSTAGQDSYKSSARVGEVVYLIDDDRISAAAPMVRLRQLR